MQFKFGAVLRACRERAGLSQEKLAELLHRSRSCISKIETDIKAVDAQTLIQWANVTNAKEVLVAYLCGMDGLAIMQTIFGMTGIG